MDGPDYWATRRTGRESPDETAELIAHLRALVEQRQQELDQAVQACKPAVALNVGDLSMPADGFLHQLPGVAQVDVAVSTEQPGHRYLVCGEASDQGLGCVGGELKLPRSQGLAWGLGG